jgi:hypothetical protein
MRFILGRDGRRANPRHQCRAPLGPMARLGSLRYPCPILGVRSCSVDRDTPQTIGCTRASPGSGDPSCRMINTAPSMATDDVVSIAGMKNSWRASKLCTPRRGPWRQPQTAHEGERIENRGRGQDGRGLIPKMTLSGFAILGVILDSHRLNRSMAIIELDDKCIQCRRMSKTPGFSMFWSCRRRHLTWTGRLSTPSPSLRLRG